MKWKLDENKPVPEIVLNNEVPSEQEVPQLYAESTFNETVHNIVNEVVVNGKTDMTSTQDIVMTDIKSNEIDVINSENITEITTNDEFNWKAPATVDSEEKSFNQLIDEVAELDEIYSSSQCNKNTFILEDVPIVDIDATNNFDDTKTYSSLQMAFKTPLNIAYRPLEDKPQLIFSTISEEQNTDRQIGKRESSAEKLPPLPPKRQKKVETYIGEDSPEEKRLKEALLHPKPIVRSRSFSTHPASVTGDLKYLGSTSTLPNPKKKSFFSKLFGRKNKDKSNLDMSSTYNSSKSLHSPQNNKTVDVKSISLANIQVTPRCTPSRDILKNDDNPQIENMDPIVKRRTVSDNESLNLVGDGLDLTEAEHYALYTVMAPHATQSEFDEMSCYYATVEGGKILS